MIKKIIKGKPKLTAALDSIRIAYNYKVLTQFYSSHQKQGKY